MKISKPPPTALETLQDLDIYLRRYVYHFRNGDRHQISFRHVQSFRKEVTALLADVEEYYAVRKLTKSVPSKTSGEVQLSPKVQARVQAWQELGFVETWWTVFTQLARQSNAAKGVFLIAVLAEVRRIAGWDGIEGEENVKNAGARIGL